MSAQTVLFSFAAVKAPAARRQGPRRAPPGEIQNARRTPRLDPKRLPLHAERVSMYFHDDVTAR
jgi:hypothetical protein